MKHKSNQTFYTGTSFCNVYNIMRILDGRMVASNIELCFEIEASEDATSEQHILAMNKIKYWLNTYLNESISFNIYSEIDATTLTHLDNNIIFCPDEPTDITLLLLVAAKLHSISQGHIHLGHFELSSDTSQGLSTWVDGDSISMLPTNVEWVGPHCYYDRPWWMRSDGSTIDMWAADEDDITQKPDIIEDLDVFETRTITVINDEPAEIIKPNFKPVIVDD